MAILIQVTQADPGHGSYISHQVTVNVNRILIIEDYESIPGAHSRIYLENGKSLYVEETQDDIRAMANEGAGGML